VFLFIFLQLPAFTQIVHTRPYISTPITWDSALEEFERDFLDKPFKTPNPKIILSFEEIIFIDGDTLTIFLNDSPECLEDSISVDRIWKSAIDTKYQNCFISLFYFKNENEYGLRLFYPEDKHGFEYYMKPFKVDIIPYKKD
jgi:hypothetical protein